VTDSRDQRNQPPPRAPQRPSTSRISVDSILQYGGDIPSQQQRIPAPIRRAQTGARVSNDPRLSARLAPQHMPARSTKVSEKLVYLPEADDDPDEDEETAKDDFGTDNLGAPTRDNEEAERKRPRMLTQKSYAERLPKSRRAEKLARVTAYCTAQAYKMKATTAFLREKHAARTKLYDECLYTVYHLPLLPGSEGYRIRSSPALKSPGGKAVLDEAIERSEQRDYHEGYFEDVSDVYEFRDSESPRNEEEMERRARQAEESLERSRMQERQGAGARSESPVEPDMLRFAEMFVFSYGIVVFWNFTERQEKDILADLTFASSESGVSLATRPQREDDFETEEFHFEYSPESTRPRLFNDMITLRTGDHMVKLAMSHAIAQSTKLSFFEEQMATTMSEAQYVPKRLALTGQLGMDRAEILTILGRLFKSRVDVNLCEFTIYIPYLR
jgi:uncharacterized Rmd1/YagE family protein